MLAALERAVTYRRWRAADIRSILATGGHAPTPRPAGGVPAKVLADRMGCLKGGVVANVVVPTPDYVRFAAHYGFGPDFCNGNDPLLTG